MSFDRQFLFAVLGLAMIVLGSQATPPATTPAADSTPIELPICYSKEVNLECEDKKQVNITSAIFKPSPKCADQGQGVNATECVSSTLLDFYKKQCGEKSKCSIKADPSVAPLSDECKAKKYDVVLKYDCSSAGFEIFKYVSSLMVFVALVTFQNSLSF